MLWNVHFPKSPGAMARTCKKLVVSNHSLFLFCYHQFLKCFMCVLSKLYENMCYSVKNSDRIECQDMCKCVRNDSFAMVMWRQLLISNTIYSYYTDVIMSLMASQITSLTIVYSPVCSGADQRKYQSFASLAFVRGIHRRPVNSPNKRPVMRKMFPFDFTSSWYGMRIVDLFCK